VSTFQDNWWIGDVDASVERKALGRNTDGTLTLEIEIDSFQHFLPELKR
jgi:hypothetical protein